MPVAILTALVPLVNAVSQLLVLANKSNAKQVSKAEVEKEIARIKASIADAEASDRALFDAFKKAKKSR